jgi:uncharacterized protein (TIGR02145 family)
VPSDNEWSTLISNLGQDVGGKMKSMGLAYWNSPNEGATNSSGFSALPGGDRNSSGNFSYIKGDGVLWSATARDVNTAWYFKLYSWNTGVLRTADNKSVGASVRCLKD